MAATEVFWNDLRDDLRDPEFLREYVAQWARIATTDAIVNALDDRRAEIGLSKAALARAINADPAALRRLLSAPRTNPTVGTVAEIAAALGLRLVLEPLDATDRELMTTTLLEGQAPDVDALISRIGAPGQALVE